MKLITLNLKIQHMHQNFWASYMESQLGFQKV